jgi:2-keto-4-pentenoate hydratase/2-oxohepta-3-ene-1,7-dioic acid hydratase in catechol pathway
MNLQVRCWINGQLYQDYPTSDMANAIPRVIEWVTWITTLQPGDIVACGTNHQGLCAIQNGDLVEVETEGLGRLAVNVRDDLGREWDRTPRGQKSAEQQGFINTGGSIDRVSAS